MRGEGRDPIFLTTIGSATQLYTPITRLGSQDFVILGTAVGQNYQLPDARREPMIPGVKTIKKTFTNSSSNFVGICASGSTTFLQRIPPRGVATFVLTAAGTAAGTWAVSVGDTSRVITDKFNSVSAGSVFGWGSSINGANALVQPQNPQGLGGFGIMAVSTGNSGAGRACLHTIQTSGSASNFTPGGCSGAVGLDIVLLGGAAIGGGVGIDALSQYGWGCRTDATANEHALGFDVNLVGYGNYNFRLLAANNSVVTPLNTGVACANSTKYRLTLEWTSNGPRLDGWINRVWVGAVTTNHPTGTRSVSKQIRVIDVAGAVFGKAVSVVRVTESWSLTDTDL